MVDAPDLCQILWPWHAGHSRLFRLLALAVLHIDTYWAGTCKTGGVGISFPKRLRMQLEFPKRNVLVCTYVTLVPRGNEMQRLDAILSASLPVLASFPEADAGFTTHAFIPADHYVTSPVMSRPSNGQIIRVFRVSHTDGIPKASPDVASRSLEELGLYT